MPGQYSPQGELELLNITPEVTFGVKPGSPTWVGHCFRTLGGKTTIDDVARAPRGSFMTPVPGTGGRTWGGSLDVEATQDTIPQLLAYTLGGQNNLTATLYSSTLSATAATGATTISVASSLFVYKGMVLTLGSETVSVTGISGLNQLSISATAAVHNNNSAVTALASANGAGGTKLLVITPATPIPSFTAELIRVPTATPGGPVTTDYLGCCIDQLTMSIAPKQTLQTKFNLVAKDDSTFTTSPSSVTLSSLFPYIFEQQNTLAQIGGEVMSSSTSASLMSWSLTINNNLKKDNFAYGSGNEVRSFPEQQRTVTGQMQLLFESQTQLNNFNAAQYGGNLPSISALIPLVGTNPIIVPAGPINWAIGIWLPKLKLRTLDFGDDTTKAITQTYAFSAGESSPGANDAIQFYCDGLFSALY